MLYRLALKLNDALWRSGRRKSRAAQIPTVVIGNITVGGTGKTPHTEMVLRLLLESGEWGANEIAMLSRGYRRSTRGYRIVDAGSTAQESGDEPLQIKKNAPWATVAVCKDRLEGCRRLGEEEGARIVVLDDAFQYRKLKATVSIVLVDWNRPVSKDRVLPWGKLRDLPGRLSDADIVIVTKCPDDLTEEEAADFRRGLDVPPERVFFTSIAYCDPQAVFPEGDRHYLYSKHAVMFTAIANDKPLRWQLMSSYRIFRRFSFPDHHPFSRKDVMRIADAALEAPVAVVMTTQKDAQRLLDCKKVPDVLRSRTFAVPIEAVFVGGEDERARFARTLLSAIR